MIFIKNYKKISLILLLLIISFTTGCADINFNNNPNNNDPGNNNNNNNSTNDSEIIDNNDVKDIEISESTHDYSLISNSDDTYNFECQDEDCSDILSFTATCESGTNCITVTDNKITFAAISEDTTYSISGSFFGTIEINVSDDYEFELSLQGFTLTSENDVPINILSGDKVTISAKKSTENYIYDTREEVSEEGISASIYSEVDLSVQGKGSLYIKSANNNGIHTKDDLSIKNLFLQVDCIDNALKGNDGVTIESGDITLISRSGDGIKTTNSHLSSKGKQKGDVSILGGNILIYSACDGIDSAHDVIVNESESEVNIQVFTDKYSSYSDEVTATSESYLYVRYSNTTYKYSIEYSNDNGSVWYNSSTYKTQNGGGMGGFGGSRTQYYYPITKPSGYTKIRLFIYSSSQSQGQEDDYVAKTDYVTINNNYDTIAIENRGGNLNMGWTNYSTTQGGFGPGGMQEGNSDKGDYSTKGIKADNEINISAGTITISSYDDAIHTNNDVELGEEGAYYYGTGNINISEGSITIHSNDDGIHADGVLTISGGTINITNSYEGLEGNSVVIAGGNTSIKSSDDGINATTTTGTGITISDGYLYVYAGGDGLDANSRSSYTGFNISGGKTVVISTGNADSALDTEQGYSFTGGYVVAICRSGGMGNESTKCSNFSSVGTSKTISLTQNNYLVVDGIVKIKMPTSISALVVVLGKTSASVSSSSSSESSADSNGVIWSK